MKIDKELMVALEEGRAAADAGEGRKANPYYYTSAMSDAWAIGHGLGATRRILDVAKIVGLSSRGLAFEHTDGHRYRYRVSHIPSTGGHEIWRSAL